jgi:hypothetical protein
VGQLDHRIQIVAIVGAAGLLLFVLEMVRRRRLLERYALIWLFCASVLLGLAIWRNGLARLAETFGIAYAPNALFFVAFGFVLVLLLHFSAAVSRLADQSKVLAQRLALLEERLRDQERRLGGSESTRRGLDGEPLTIDADVVDADDAIEPVGGPRATRR